MACSHRRQPIIALHPDDAGGYPASIQPQRAPSLNRPRCVADLQKLEWMINVREYDLSVDDIGAALKFAGELIEQE